MLYNAPMNITKRAYAVMAGLVVTAGTVAYSTNRPYQVSGADEPIIVQQVNRHEDQLANHEARLSNVESDVASVQTQTNSAPATNKVAVPAVSQPAPTAAPAAATTPQKTVVSSYTCRVTVKATSVTSVTDWLVTTYSDGSKTVSTPDRISVGPGAPTVEACQNNQKPSES